MVVPKALASIPKFSVENRLFAIQLSQLYNKTPPLRKPRLGKNPSNEANTVNIFAYSDGVHFGMAGVVLAPARKRMI